VSLKIVGGFAPVPSGRIISNRWKKIKEEGSEAGKARGTMPVGIKNWSVLETKKKK